MLHALVLVFGLGSCLAAAYALGYNHHARRVRMGRSAKGGLGMDGTNKSRRAGG